MPITACDIAAVGVEVVGGLGDEGDIDKPDAWRVAVTPDGYRLEVFETRVDVTGGFDPEWHEAEISNPSFLGCPVHRIVYHTHRVQPEDVG